MSKISKYMSKISRNVIFSKSKKSTSKFIQDSDAEQMLTLLDDVYALIYYVFYWLLASRGWPQLVVPSLFVCPLSVCLRLSCLGNGAQRCWLFTPLAAGCTRLTACARVGSGLPQLQVLLAVLSSLSCPPHQAVSGFAS